MSAKTKKIQLPEEELPPEEKIWVVLKEISNAIELAPKDDMAVIDPVKLDRFIMRAEQEQIFKKLEKDYNFLKIYTYPYDLLLDMGGIPSYRFKVFDVDALRQLANEAHTKQFGSLSKLSGSNFLAVVDVSRDISDALQMTDQNDVKIPFLPSLIKFPNLMPADGVNFRDRYCDLRWQACGYLKNNGHIVSFDIEDTIGLHRWEYKITIILDRLKWDNFYEKLAEKADKRIVYESNLKDKKEEEIQPKKETTEKEIPETQRPMCSSENGIGYLKFGKFGEKIEIGRETSQPYKLLLCVIEPFGVAKKVDAVFEAIRENVKDKSRGGVYTDAFDKNKKIQLIKFTIKELQKENKLRGKLQFKWDDMETKLWLEFIG